MRALSVSLTADDYAHRLAAWFVNDVLLYEGVKAAYEREQASD